MARDATVLVVGLGDLGTRVFDMLAVSPVIGRLVGAGRDRERAAALRSQGRLMADLSGGPGKIDFAPLNLHDHGGTIALVKRLDPALVVMAASQRTWWRTATSLAPIPYGAWLPVQLQLVRALMEAVRTSGIDGRVICLPFPDAVGPALSPLNLAPDIGAGNVTEVAAKLKVLAAERFYARTEEIEVRLIMHHAAERHAFSAFSALAGSAGEKSPPWLAEIRVGGEEISAEIVADLFAAPYPLPVGTATHQLTAAATVHLIHAMLSDERSHTHAPAPHGLPGGYPVMVSRSEIVLDLPANVTAERAIALNNEAARSDGIESIESDGTIVFTESVARVTEEILGFRLHRMTPDDQAEIAQELLDRAALIEGQRPIAAG